VRKHFIYGRSIQGRRKEKDSLIYVLRESTFRESVSVRLGGKSVYANYLVQYKTATGQLQGRLFNFVYDPLANEVRNLSRFEGGNRPGTGRAKEGQAISKARELIEFALQSAILEWLPDRQSRAGLQISLIGLYLNT